MAFQPIYNAFPTKPKGQFWRSHMQGNLSMLRDNFHIHTWLLMGAFLQGLLCLLPYRSLALVAPVSIVLFLSVARTLLQSYGILRHPYMDTVIDGRTAAFYPDETGQFDKPADRQICVIMLASRSNHPLGMFAPGFKEVGDFFESMAAELDKNATEYGFLGNSAWIAAGERGVSSETMSLCYFESPEKLHAYAHGPLHTAAMEWWHKTEKEHGHIGLMHEVFAVPKNMWEGIYVNYHPTGLGATSLEAKGDQGSVWINPLVRVQGKLRYSKGRMGRPFGEREWPAFEKWKAVE